MAPGSIYIHIPFCAHKCHYCDFTAYVVGGQPVDDYLEALAREMAQTVEEIPPGKIETIFIGGGTPTVLTPRQMERLLKDIRRYFPHWSDQLEFTVEANPGTTEPDQLAVLKEGGVNRLSFGAQTFRPELLAEIGRDHGVDEIAHSVAAAREAGIDNVSLDLMFGLPRQSVADMEEALVRGLALSPDHFSVYSLTVEEGTVFHHRRLQGKLPLPSEDDELEMYLLTRRRLEEAGYPQYEVSNFSRPGRESRHNSTYWLNESYYGLGAGAHGYTEGLRHENVHGVKEYIRLSHFRRPIADTHQVSTAEAMENHFILGLRLRDGVSQSQFAKLYGTSPEAVFGSVLEDLQKRCLIQQEEDRYRLTEKGLLFGNNVFAAFIEESA
ncbi:oxygen-independent coproporphyrinogen-3 oxidase [Kroppenstedtia sanguinis]|uniref:radical SAM family heme chaperone HemW n=1 Tax=Kroppenstedtia sanguinis TaxID=1380684 RepID=UPI003D213B52